MKQKLAVKLKSHQLINNVFNLGGKKKAQEGGRNLSVWLNADTVKQMDFLLDKFPDKNKASLVAHAIESLYQKTDLECSGQD